MRWPIDNHRSITDRQHKRLTAVFTGDDHVQVEATWSIYQKMINAYRDPDRSRGKATMTTLIAALRSEVPAALLELRRWTVPG